MDESQLTIHSIFNMCSFFVVILQEQDVSKRSVNEIQKCLWFVGSLLADIDSVQI